MSRPAFGHIPGPDLIHPSITSLLISLWIALLLVAGFYLAYRDYQAFLSLGPGGTPPTVQGYLRIKFLSLFKLRDPYKPMPIPSSTRPHTGYLTYLPKRGDERPEVKGIAPQRQVTQKGSPDAFAALSDTISSLAMQPRNQLVLGTSCFEKHGTGLFSVAPVTRTCKGEVCHAHPSDGSLHMTLHPADVSLVLERGWGERHPLARGGWLSRFVPANFVMVYAPRDKLELDVVTEIICAAAWWVGGRVITRKDNDKEKQLKGGKRETEEEVVSFCRCCQGRQRTQHQMPGIVRNS